MVTLTAVGYGDIVAYSTAESYFAALWIFVGGIINFAVMGAMSSTISNMTATHHHHMEKINTVNSIMERVSISRRLSAEIRRFYHQLFVGHKEGYESQLLSNLPDQLCYQISSLLHSTAVKSVSLFDSASIEFLRAVTGKFRHRNYQNGEAICLEGDTCHKFFVFLQGSKVNIFFRSRKVPIRALQAGDSYGVNEFLLKRTHSVTLMAASMVHASVMTREQFDIIQRKFADDLRDMKEEAHNLWAEDNKIMKLVMANLAKPKLQPHVLQTPSLFYQRDNTIITHENEKDHHFVTPFNKFKTVWSALITCWNLYNATFVIFRICFHSHLHFSSNMSVAVWIADLTCDACFAVDMYLRLYYFGCPDVSIENLVERKEVDKHYLRSSTFKWDILASLPVYTPFASSSMITGLCRLPRLVRCIDLWNYLDDFIVQIQQQFASHHISAYLSPVKLIIVLVLVAHYTGCIFYLISEHECQQLERCWMTHDPILHEYHDSVPMFYAKTFYWAITTLCLVGSREIVPRGMAGSLWTGFTCLCCTFVIGHIVGEISELILELGKETKQYKSRIASFENFAKEHELSAALRERVTYFFQVEFEETKGSNVSSIMHDLSANLRLKFMVELYGRSIELLPISTFLTATQINNLALRLQPELFIPGDNILVEGTFGSRLCTLKKGMAAAYWTKSIASVAVLSEGAFFGEIAFFLPNQRRLASVRATTSCEVLHISKQDWQELWIPSDDVSDSNVQKHAQYAILGWVNSRLQRYQRGCLRTAIRAKGATVPRRPSIKESVSRKASKLFAKDKALTKDGHVLLWAPTPPRKVSKAEICRMFVSPTVQLLEKKAEYILSKSSACAQPLSSKEPARRTSSGSNKADDLRQRQFIIDINPINEYLSDSLGADTIRELEKESWARFKLLVALQHVVGRLLSDLIPSDIVAESTPSPRIKTLVNVIKPKQLRPFRFDDRAKRKWSAAITQMAASVSRRKTIGPEVVASEEAAIAQPRAKLAPVRRRSFPAVLSSGHGQSKPSPNATQSPTLLRCRSLQFFDDSFFSDMSHFKNYSADRKGESGIDFEILQRCQRPQYATQLHWYHRYRQWKSIMIPRLQRLVDLDQKKSQISPLSEGMKLAGSQRTGNMITLPIPNQQALRAVMSDFESKQFIKCVMQLGKAWDLLMLLIAVYHLLVTPFKICFSHEVIELTEVVLNVWSGIEIFLDMLSFIDVVHKFYHITYTHNDFLLSTGELTTNGATSAVGIHHFLVNSELRTDIAAMLPLELLLLVPSLRLPILHIHNTIEAVDASWWTTRWVLRINRMLFVRRIQPLSEELFQYAIQGVKIPVSEALLYFLRSLASYLAMGHLLACLWFVTSEIGLWYYGVSWLSTPGMLTYISKETITANVGESHRFLQEIASNFTLTSVSLTRQYLRSLLFSMECISTLFYGDIISMNPLELIVEIGITFWAISIYGALVGAQGEWIDSQARQEAAFEQNLSELQHFLNLNDVPKGLKRQVKTYYARMWRRHQGKSEFASVANVSRALYEDVVLATQSDFAAQVGVFQALDENFLRGLLVCLEYVVCSAGEEIVSKGEMDRSMYFIAEGHILVRMESGESIRERGEFFGEFALLYGISRLETCIALGVAELYRLDHEPYEQLLQDFPGYRRRNKQAWTTPGTPNRSVNSDYAKRTDSATALIGMSPILANRMNVKSLDVVTMQLIENKLPHTYVYKSTMEMLAQLQTMRPDEVKSLILKCRAGSRKRLILPRTNGPKELLLVNGPSPTSIPTPRPTHKRLLQRVSDAYNLYLSWTARQTLVVAVNLCVTLYIFITVPLRVAFFYDPHVQSWTDDLSVFVITDAIADIIGMVHFVLFYRQWKQTFIQVVSSESASSTSSTQSDTVKVMVRTPSFVDQHRGKIKWTIATIFSALSMSMTTETTTSRKRQLFRRNVELLLELVAVVPMEMIPMSMGSYNALHLVRLTKLCRLYKLRRCFVRVAQIYSDRAWAQHLSSTGIDTLVQSIGLCAGMCHWVACGYMLIAHAQCGTTLEFCNADVETSWVVRDRLFGASVGRKYGRTLYWASRTLVLLGYDDVTPVSNAETVYVIVVVLMGALFGSSLLANFLFLFRFRNARYAAFAAHVDNAREYMRSRRIPRSLRHQVIAYFSYTWNTHHSLDSEEALRLMPKHLQTKVVSTIKASRIKQVSFLAKESVEFTNMLALALVRRIYSPGDQIIEPKINAETFFVIRGKVVLSAFNGSNVKEIGAGDCFADSCLIYPEQYEQFAVAKTFCELYVLAKSKFDQALVEFYRGNSTTVRLRMTDTLDKYTMQVQKMQKMLGLQGNHQSGSRTNSMMGTSRSLVRLEKLDFRSMDWHLPGSHFSAIWDTARLAAIIFMAFEVPYFAVFISMGDETDTFAVQHEIGLRYILTLLTEIFFGIDLVLRSRYFAYLDPNVMLNVVQPHLIFEAYRANGFYIDLLAWLPVGLALDIFPASVIQGYSAIFRLLRLLRLRLTTSLLKRIADFYGISSKLHTVVSLVLWVSLMLHMVGCTWFKMTLIGRDSDSLLGDGEVMSALTRSECLQHATKFHNCSWAIFDCYSHIGVQFPAENPGSMYQASFAYLRSLYWAVVTLTAVGYGDIVAYSTAESCFAAFWIFIGGIINFGVVGAMSSTISNAMAPHHHHIEQINTLNTVLERMEISEKLSTEIRRFYHHQFTGRKQAYESQLLLHLPDQLCYKISSLLHSEAVKSIPLFESASFEFLKEVTGKFRHRSYQNGETICLEGDKCRDFFVFLHTSKVNVFFRLRKVPIRALCGGDCYGVSEFLLKRPYPATLTAASHVHASVMTRDQFEAIQRKFSEDVNYMTTQAEVLWTQEQNVLARIVANLEKLKLQPHSMHTPTLFYHRESALIPKGIEEPSVEFIQNTFSSTWNAFITSWNVYNALFVVFRICFNSHLHYSSNIHTIIWVADLSCDVFFAIDIYLRLYFFGCTEVGIENLLSRKEVDKDYYRSSSYKWDLLASLPIYTFTSGTLSTSLCRLPRLIRCVDLWGNLDGAIVIIQQHFASHNVSAYLSPVKLMIILVLVAHYVGCIFFWISEHECEHVERCWMEHDHMLHQYHHSVVMLYAKSFYWAITTLLLVGSRESVPRDTAGTLWTSFTCLCCTFIIGHIVGEISELILELGKETKEYKSRIASFESFAKTHDLPVPLRERVTYFFRVQFEHSKGSDLFSIVHDLSANLRLKLMLEIYGHSIANLPICRFLTASQVNNLVLRLKPELFIPGDNILVEGTYGNRLCTLRKGMAAVYWTKAVAAVSILMEGAFFGEVAFFLPNQRRLATVRATTFCEVLYISKHDWQELWDNNGNAADNHIQKHAFHTILGWVSSRLQRYQQASLRAANRAKRFMTSSPEPDNFPPTKRDTRSKGKLANGITAPRRMSQAEVCRLFVSPEVQILERKAEYILTKSDECAEKFNNAIARIQAHRSSLLDTVRSSLRTTLKSASQSRDRAMSNGNRWNSANVDASSVINVAADDKAADIRLLQFIVDLNPLNKHVSCNMEMTALRSLEDECWARFGLLATAQHEVSKLLNALLPSETSLIIRRAQNKNVSGPQGKRQMQTWLGASFRRIQSTKTLVRAVPKATKTIMNGKTPNMRSPFVIQGGRPTIQRKRRLSVETRKEHLQPLMTRCRSLPVMEDDFFGDEKHKQEFGISKKVPCGIDFEILQRCQQPQYATQLHWYHRFRQWRCSIQGSVMPGRPSASIPAGPRKSRGHALSLTRDTQIPGFRSGHSRVAAMGSRLHLPSQRSLFSATTDLQSKVFIQRVKELGKIWDLIILIVAVYHLIVTPFKISFSPVLIELPAETLQNWSALEIFLDIVCLVDVVYHLHQASMTQSNMFSAANSSTIGLLRTLTINPEVRTYTVAMLPLELLLLTDVRVSSSQSSMSPIDASWWTTRWLLRMNRILIIRRIGPLSEQLFQYIVHDVKVHTSEEMLYFMRDLLSYLATGHLLACIWFITSETGFHQYGASWLSTSGMLTYISDGSTVVEHTSRMLSQTTSTFYLESVSLFRKYIRSFLFSIECISTLFYGDILSMNPLELVVEIAITFWSIYIYGALVGAQAELLDARARREAMFEQRLGELHHYVVQNGVPKALKHQIKCYYARLWRRSRGEDDFASVKTISRVLFEDVVSTTLRHFVAQVNGFRGLEEHFLRALLVCLHYVVCDVGEEVVVKGDVDRSMYFIALGRVVVKTEASEIIRERGEYFGELTLLYGISRLETCVALSVTDLYRLDHEPYERLLLDFPEYRTRNKLAWTIFADPDRAESHPPPRLHRTLASRPSIAKVVATTAENVDSRLQFSFVHKASMKMMANMQSLHPLEAKELLLKCREGARKQLLHSVKSDGENMGMVFAAGPNNSTLLVTGHPSLNPLSPSHKPKQKVLHQTSWRTFYRRTVKQVEQVYKKLPWTTRQTIRSCVSLYALLYIFVTVPFRVAFYYNPFNPGVEHYQWTKELSVFTAMDVVTDVIGLFEFFQFYHFQKTIFGPRFVSFDLGRTASRNQSLFPPPGKLMRTSSFKNFKRGKTKWTLASIGRSASLKGSVSDSSHLLRSKKLELLLEVVAIFPIEVIPYASGAYNTLHVVRMTKICRLYRLRRSLKRFANIYSDRTWMQHLSSTGINSLVRNIGLCAGLCHYVACGYMLLAHAQCGVSLEKCDRNVETSWAVRDRLFGASVARKYARTLYWASRTMVLLGYDDVTPVSDAETIYAVMVTLMGALFGSSLLATFLFIFRFRNARYAAFSTHVDNAREYMRSQNIPRAVRRQVIAYFTYSWNTHHSLDSEEALHLMPKHLQSKVVSTLKASRVKQVCFLAKESVEFINLLAAALARRVYSPGDQIIEPKFNAQMFFVIRGSVMLSAFDGSNPKECQTGDFFADTCLLFPETFEEKAIAKTFCELYVLAKSKFDDAVSEFYRENEVDVRTRMGESHEKHMTQLRKTKKLLGMRNRANSGRNSFGGSPHNITTHGTNAHDVRRDISWRFPGSVFRVHWDAVRLVSIVYIAFEVPYYSVFISKREVQHMFVDESVFGLRYYLTLMIEYFFGVDLVLRSRYLAQLDPIVMLIVDNPSLIFAAYKANGFYLDFFAWLPFGIILESLPAASGQRYSWIFRMLRLLRLREIPALLWNVCDYYSVSSKAHLVISLVLGVTFMLHVVGCVWFEMAWISEVAIVGHSDTESLGDLSRPDCLQHSALYDNCSWVTFDCYAHIGNVFPAESPDSTYQASFAYMRSVYWAIVTLTAVGYGDIVAYSTAESLFAAFWIFVGGIINFGVVGAMSSTISNAMAPHHHHMEKLNKLNNILERMDISEKLSAEIRRFYHHEFTGRKQAYESQLLVHLPDQLCYDISSLLHSESVKRVALFDSASIEFLKEVTGKFRHRIYQNGDSICLEGDICREFFVLLHGSKVNVFFRSRKVPIRALHEGDSYGVMAFLLRRAHPATLTAASLVHASVMTREQFDIIQRKFNEDLNDMKEEAQILWVEQQKNMRRIVHNLEKLKLQPHMMSTSTLFYQGDTSVAATPGNETKAVRDINATREMLTSVWNGFITYWNTYNTIFVIFRICFHSHLHFSSGTDTAVWIADLCCDVCFAIDIYLRLYYFGCHDVGLENLVQRKEIDNQYRQNSTFKWDILASLPIYAPFTSGSLVCSLCRLPRLVRSVDLWTYLDDVIVLIQQHFASHNVSAYLSPVKLMIIL
ncbi:LOW QUALITY PROTEIN: Hypothetical protein PHPALM_11549, partial [Phytophthora palmivora]